MSRGCVRARETSSGRAVSAVRAVTVRSGEGGTGFFFGLKFCGMACRLFLNCDDDDDFVLCWSRCSLVRSRLFRMY